MTFLIRQYLKKCSMARKTNKESKRAQRKRDKELSVRFRIEGEGEDFHTFRARLKKPKF